MTSRDERIRKAADQCADAIVKAVFWQVYAPRIVALALMAIGFLILAILGD